METQVSVVGVTGTVGSRVAVKLAQKGIQVRGIARDLSRFAGPANVDLMVADLTDHQEAEKALKNSRAVYLTPPEMGEDPLALESAVGLNVIEAAKRTGIQHVMLHTALQANKGKTGTGIIDRKRQLEQALESSGIGYTILRPGWFFQNLFLAKDYFEQGMFSMPWPPERRIGGVSVEDIASAAVALLEKGPQNRGFDLHLPGGVTGTSIAQAASRVLGRSVQYVEFTNLAWEFVASFPLSEPHKALYAELFEYFRQQDYLGQPEALQAVLPGFQYTSVGQFMRSELFSGKGRQ